jgi:hypothetical protein
MVIWVNCTGAIGAELQLCVLSLLAVLSEEV